LLAVGTLSTSCHKAISADGSASSIAILNLVSSACTKKEKKYREAAFASLEQVSCSSWVLLRQSNFSKPLFFGVNIYSETNE
jgi:hypothetical protein